MVQIKVCNVMSLTLMVGTIPPVTEKVVGGAELHGSDQGR